MASNEDVVILRDAAGAPQHAVMPWARYETLRRAAEGRPPAPAGSPPRRAEGVSALRAWREHRGFSQAQLAALTGISRVYLSQIETGERAGTVEVMAGIARNLGCRIEDLLPGNDGDEFALNVAALARLPARLLEITAAIPEDHWRARVPGSEFSLLEQICHLRDIDHDGYRVRIARMLDETTPELADIDGTKLAEERDYQRQDLRNALGAFVETRAGIVQRLRGLTPGQQARTGRLEDAGVMSVAALAGAMIAHDSGHLDELATLSEQLAKKGG